MAKNEPPPDPVQQDEELIQPPRLSKPEGMDPHEWALSRMQPIDAAFDLGDDTAFTTNLTTADIPVFDVDAALAEILKQDEEQ
jgi:hypothetical protein